MNYFKKIFYKIKNYFNKSSNTSNTTNTTNISVFDNNDYITPKDLTSLSYNIIIPEIQYPQPKIEGKPNILIMDDFTGMANLIYDEMKRIQCCDVYNNFNILLATGNYAAFTVENFLKDNAEKIDVAILDITLGGVINAVEYDGIDTAILLKKYNPNCVIRFITGHTLNKHNPEIFKFIQKFEHFFKTPIDETQKVKFKNNVIEMYKHVISKNGNRVAALGNLIQEYYDSQDYHKLQNTRN